MLKWPGFIDRLRENSINPSLRFLKYDGTVITKLEPPVSEGEIGERVASLGMWRQTLHELLYAYAQELGVPILFGQSAVEFTETDDQGCVTLADGTKHFADIVVAADGIGSRSAQVVATDPEPPKSSGYAIFRISFPLGKYYFLSILPSILSMA